MFFESSARFEPLGTGAERPYWRTAFTDPSRSGRVPRVNEFAPERPNLRVKIPSGHAHEVRIGAQSRRLAVVAVIRAINVQPPEG